MRIQPSTLILERQLAWARRQRILLQGSQGARGRPTYTKTLQQNLFEPLSEEARSEYAQGDGGELRSKNANPGKMQALHSSSALCCNVFHYWRRIGQVNVLARACGLPSSGSVRIGFEQKFEISASLFRRAPNLDAAFRYSTGSRDVIAVESKFCEPFSTRRHAGLSQAYLEPECDAFWQGMDTLRQMARRLSPENEEFEHLDAAQLLKHLLGLRQTRGSRLLYLYYDVPGPAGSKHRDEIERFIGIAAQDGVTVIPLTYQDVIVRLLQRGRASDRLYLNYVAERYL